MYKASIDAGSNSFILLIADVHEKQLTEVLVDEMRITRLAEGFGKQKVLLPSAFERALDAFQDYATLLGPFGISPEEVVVLGTSAIREASNQEDFIQTIKAKTGFQVKPISGKEEAHYSWLGVTSDAPLETATSPCLIDIGGGSTEFLWEQGNQSQSIPMGVVKAFERFFPNDERDLDSCQRFRDAFRKLLPASLKGDLLMAVAGTATTFISVRDQVEPYDSSRIHGKWITYQELEELLALFLSMPNHERKKIVGLAPQRSDLILSGVLMTMVVMETLGVDKVYISERGIRFGGVFA